MPTKTQQLIRHKRRRKGVLVPLLEDLFQNPVEIESGDDVEWLAALIKRMAERQDARNDRPVFSPSQLAECLRYVYLNKHHRELGIQKLKPTRIEPHFYFYNGNFLHVKWQFALYKLDKALPDEVFKLIGVEVPILSKRGDHGGTVDAIVLIYGELYIVDFKGLNVRSFGEATRGYVDPKYLSQISNYGMLYNAALKNGKSVITKGLLIIENKGGPDPKHLIALHEHEVEIQTHLPEVRRRLEVLREHGEADSIPPPECESTATIQFLGCPFRKFCKEEVQERQRRKREAESRDTEGLKVEVPNGRRNNRSRGNSKRQRQRSA